MLVETQLFFSSWPYVLERTSNKAIPKNSMVWSSPTGRKNRPYQKKILFYYFSLFLLQKCDFLKSDEEKNYFYHLNLLLK